MQVFGIGSVARRKTTVYMPADVLQPVWYTACSRSTDMKRPIGDRESAERRCWWDERYGAEYYVSNWKLYPVAYADTVGAMVEGEVPDLEEEEPYGKGLVVEIVAALWISNCGARRVKGIRGCMDS